MQLLCHEPVSRRAEVGAVETAHVEIFDCGVAAQCLAQVDHGEFVLHAVDGPLVEVMAFLEERDVLEVRGEHEDRRAVELAHVTPELANQSAEELDGFRVPEELVGEFGVPLQNQLPRPVRYLLVATVELAGEERAQMLDVLPAEQST